MRFSWPRLRNRIARPDPVRFPATAPIKTSPRPRMLSPLADKADEAFAQLQASDGSESPMAPIDTLPYAVDRTALGKALPVYVDIVKHHTLFRTIVRRIRGDVQALARDLAAVVPAERIYVKTTNGHLEIRGHYVQPIKKWLTLRGF